MSWTLTHNGTEQTLADWGFSQFTRTLQSQNVDEVSFVANGRAIDAPALFTPFESVITIRRDRVQDSGGVWSGGAIWFAGIILQEPRRGAPESESNSFKAAGPWWYLKSIVFEKTFTVFNGYSTPGDTTTATFIQKYFSHCFLLVDQTVINQDPNLPINKLNTGQQIVEALNWALKPFVDAGAPPPFQIGTVSPDLDVPIQEVRDITCAEVIRMMLRWSPDAATWFDYTTSPPTFHCRRRADFTVVTLGLNDGNLIKDLRINPRKDLQSSYVLIRYEQNETVDGISWMQPATDQFPDPLPTDPLSQFNALRFTVDLQGVQATNTTAKLLCEPIALTDPDWWLARNDQLKTEASADNPITSVTFVEGSFTRNPTNAGDADQSFTNELVDGDITEWMGFKSQRITAACKVNITHKNGNVTLNHPVAYKFNSTDANTGTFNQTNVTNSPEPVPIGLAEKLYDAVSVLQYDGDLVLQEQEVSGRLGISNLFNFTGGALPEWSSMNALVHRITENLDAGETTVEFGPTKILGAGDLVDLLRVNRNRVIRYNVSLALQGSARGGGNVGLGKNAPEKNSMSTPGYVQTSVVSGTIDGSGPVQTTTATAGGTVTTQWLPNGPMPPAGTPYPPGSVTIKLTDIAPADAANGIFLKIQKFPVCQDGVSGTFYLLCSDFIPDP